MAAEPTSVMVDPARAVARLARQLERSLDAVDLSPSQFRLLGFLAEGSAAASALAERLAVSPPSVTSLVDGLVARGLVVRKGDPDDRRRLSLTLSAKGRKVLAKADALGNQRLREIAEMLDEPTATELLNALGRWNDALDLARTAKDPVKPASR